MIVHFEHRKIDKALWDARLLRSANRLWYMQSWVLDIASPGWEALVDEGSGAIMPLTWRSKFGVRYLFQPYGLQQQGVFAPRLDPVMSAAFIGAVPDRFPYWDIYLNEAMHIIGGSGDQLSENRQQALKLEGDVDALRSGYSQGHRRNLRKAVEGQLPVVDDIEASEFTRLFIRTTATRFGNMPAGSMQVMEQLITASIRKGQCRILGMRDRGEPIAAVCFMEWEGRSILFKSANDAAGQERQAMFHLIDRYIADHAGSGIILDFAGSNNASVARFNSGFGAHSTIYLRLKRNRLPGPLRWLKK